MTGMTSNFYISPNTILKDITRKRFSEEVVRVLNISDRKEKRERKRVLVETVKEWIKENPETAKEEFAISAKEVIDILKGISKQID
jgi:hypothetical protein